MSTANATTSTETSTKPVVVEPTNEQDEQHALMLHQLACLQRWAVRNQLECENGTRSDEDSDEDL